MVTLNSTTYGTRTGYTFNTTTWPTITDVNGWCTRADELIEAMAGSTLTYARSTNALTAIATIIVRRIHEDEKRKRFEDAKTGFQEEVLLQDRGLRSLVKLCFMPDGLQIGTFKLVKDRVD